MINILTLIAVVYLASYVFHRVRKTPEPAKAALIPAGIIVGAMVVLGLLVYLSLQ